MADFTAVDELAQPGVGHQILKREPLGFIDRLLLSAFVREHANVNHMLHFVVQGYKDIAVLCTVLTCRVMGWQVLSRLPLLDIETNLDNLGCLLVFFSSDEAGIEQLRLALLAKHLVAVAAFHGHVRKLTAAEA